MINLRKNSKNKEKNVNNGHDTLTKNTNGIVQVSPSPTKKRLTESEIEYKIKDMMVHTLRSYFLAQPGYCIATVDEFKNVSYITQFFIA